MRKVMVGSKPWPWIACRTTAVIAMHGLFSHALLRAKYAWLSASAT